MRTNAISLTSLLYETVELHHNINRTHPNIRILQIITPKNGINTATMKYQRGGFPPNITFIRIIMCRYEKSLCFIMINHEHNKRLFHKYLLLQGNGTVTIVNLMMILAPHRIIQEEQEITEKWVNCSMCRTFYKIVFLEQLKIQFLCVHTLLEYCIFVPFQKY